MGLTEEKRWKALRPLREENLLDFKPFIPSNRKKKTAIDNENNDEINPDENDRKE